MLLYNQHMYVCSCYNLLPCIQLMLISNMLLCHSGTCSFMFMLIHLCVLICMSISYILCTCRSWTLCQTSTILWTTMQRAGEREQSNTLDNACRWRWGGGGEYFYHWLYCWCYVLLYRTAVFKDKEPRVLSANHQFRVVSLHLLASCCSMCHCVCESYACVDSGQTIPST